MPGPTGSPRRPPSDSSLPPSTLVPDHPPAETAAPPLRPLQVLMVVHNYPPDHGAGTETYTAELAERLTARGHRVRVFTTTKDVARTDLSLGQREHRGVPVTELVNNLYHREFRETWDHPGIAARFAVELERRRPDVVHFQHLLYLSAGCVEEAARRGLATVFTLHDFWLQCPRFGQRVHADGALCERIDFARCGTCLSRFKFAQTPLERRTGRALAGLRRATGLDLAAAARGVARAVSPGSAKAGSAKEGAVDPGLAAHREAEVRERDRDLRARVVPHVRRFVSPSRFLRDELVRWGVPAERIVHLPTGLDHAAFPRTKRPPRDPSRPLAVGFVGSLVPLKGPQLLLEAWARIDPRSRGSAELSLRGPNHHHPTFQAELARAAERVGARLGGPLPRAEIPAALAALDLLVVPSLWYENAPLVILEARAVGTPVVVAGLGGMAELVTEGRDGRHFAPGDADDLARVLAELLAEPERLQRLHSGPPVPAVEADVQRMEAIYAEVLAEVRRERASGELPDSPPGPQPDRSGGRGDGA